MLRRTFKYRLYPTGRQEQILLEQLRFSCALYNAALEQRIAAYRMTGHSPSYLSQSRELTELRRECPWLPDGMSRSTQQFVLRRVDFAFAAFFRRARARCNPGFPRYKSARRWDTLQCQSGKGARLFESQRKLHWQGAGLVRLNLHRPIPDSATLTRISIKRDGRRWYGCIEVVLPTPKALPRTGLRVGIDLGIGVFAALSTGEVVAGPRAERKGARRIASLQRQVSRKQKGSKRRRKAVGRLASARRHQQDARRDHHFKVAHSLVERFDSIFLEHLNVQALANSWLAKDVRDQAWAQFVRILSDKAEEAGRQVIRVDPANTSQMCSDCGRIVSKTLRERKHSCVCGLELDRDINAARNILRLGASQQRRDAAESRPSSLANTPVESGTGIAHNTIRTDDPCG